MNQSEEPTILTAEQKSTLQKLLGHTVLNDQTGRTCRICGCTADDCTDCVARLGEACTWTELDLCSGCDLDWVTTFNTEIALASMDCQAGKITLKVTKNNRPTWMTDERSGQIYARGYRAKAQLRYGPPINQGTPSDWHSAHFAGETRQAAQDVAQRWALETVRRYQTW